MLRDREKAWFGLLRESSFLVLLISSVNVDDLFNHLVFNDLLISTLALNSTFIKHYNMVS